MSLLSRGGERIRGVSNIWLYLVPNMWGNINAASHPLREIALMYRDSSDLIIKRQWITKHTLSSNTHSQPEQEHWLSQDIFLSDQRRPTMPWVFNCGTPDLPIPPVQLMIGKSGKPNICIVVWVVGWIFVTLATVLMLLWPLKMLKSFKFSLERTFWGLSEDSLKTLWRLSKEFLNTFQRLLEEFLRTF